MIRRISTVIIHPAFAVGSPQHRMIVCWRFGHGSAEAAWVSCRPKQCLTSTKKNKIYQISMKKIKQLSCDRRTSSRTYAVGLPTASNDSMLWTLWLVSTNTFWCRRWAFVLLHYALESFVHAIEVLLFYRILMMKDLMLSPEPLLLCHRQTDEWGVQKQNSNCFNKAVGPANRKKLISIFWQWR